MTDVEGTSTGEVWVGTRLEEPVQEGARDREGDLGTTRDRAQGAARGGCRTTPGRVPAGVVLWGRGGSPDLPWESCCTWSTCSIPRDTGGAWTPETGDPDVRRRPGSRNEPPTPLRKNNLHRTEPSRGMGSRVPVLVFQVEQSGVGHDRVLDPGRPWTGWQRARERKTYTLNPYSDVSKENHYFFL